MSVAVFPGDSGGCGNYRLRFPADAARAAGADVTVIDPGELEIPFAAHVAPDGTSQVRALDTSVLPDVDTIVMQRLLKDTGWQFVRLLKRAGYRVVVDVDDDFDRLHPANPAARQCATELAYHPSNIHRAIAEADACTVSTPALADRYRRNGTDVHILRNLVPAWYLKVETLPEAATIGWTGTVATHHNDLGELGGALGVLQRDGWTIKVIGKAGTKDLGLSSDPVTVPWLPMDDYPAEVAAFGVGIVPLADTQFNRGKSWLKGLEYAALDVPFAATATDSYRELHRVAGVGVLVEKRKAWRSGIVAAAGESGYRAKIRAAGLTYDDRWQDWVGVWSDR
jgi:hypothetical protein